MSQVFKRKMVELLPGEEQPPCLNPAPEGYRWETDDELRARIMQQVAE